MGAGQLIMPKRGRARNGQEPEPFVATAGACRLLSRVRNIRHAEMRGLMPTFT